MTLPRTSTMELRPKVKPTADHPDRDQDEHDDHYSIRNAVRFNAIELTRPNVTQPGFITLLLLSFLFLLQNPLSGITFVQMHALWIAQAYHELPLGAVRGPTCHRPSSARRL